MSAAQPDSAAPAADRVPPAVTFTTDFLTFSLAADGRVAALLDRVADADRLRSPAPLAVVRRGGREIAATRLEQEGDAIILEFGDERVRVRLGVIVRPHYLILEVQEVHGEGIEELRFLNLATSLRGRRDDPFSVCALALNLKTNVPQLPGPSAAVQASCYPRFGMVGAQVALIGCPSDRLRTIMQEVVSAAPDLPKSELGGPWAMDAPINRGSYLFNFGHLSEQTVDRWIETARRIGFTQIDFHGGHSFRFGDLQLNPQTYPNGVASLKAVIDRLHAAGIAAGLHTYAFFIDKRSTYVSPRPDPRLGKDATFTLAADLPADATDILVNEPTDRMSTTTGFFVRNSITLQIGDELITYSGVRKEPPYGFTGCQRGAYGTKVSAHAKGAPVHHLKEQFGLFVPDEDSDLLEELARRTAELFNEAGFDMIYLDALDGEGIIGGNEAGWHYGSKFVFALVRHLQRPALMEMSTFHHHLWYVRSRYVAWDHPNRGYKRFIDLHCAANDEAARMFLPGHLGWWRVQTWKGPQEEPTYTDDIEYLLAKCLGRGEGFSLQGIDPATIDKIPAFPRLAELMRRYETLRHAGTVPAHIRARLREPGAEFTLEGPADRPVFRPVQSLRQTVSGKPDGSERVRFHNPYHHQPACIRIQMLLSAGPADPQNPLRLAAMEDPAEFPDRATASKVHVTLTTTDRRPSAGEGPPDDMPALRYRAENQGSSASGAWSMVARSFDPPLDIAARPGLGMWIYGDGGGEVLNVQLRCPPHVVAGIGEHYVPIDFTGWRYVELIESEGDRCGDYVWPYSGQAYDLYREEINTRQIASVSLWYNNVPAGGAAECLIGPIEALPLVPAESSEIVLACGGRELRIEPGGQPFKTGEYLELDAQGRVQRFGPAGEEMPAPRLTGEPPVLAHGDNVLTVRCRPADRVQPRVRVMIATVGDPLE